ncbi:hypothetical protein NKCBBBOE_00127 [Pseudarthrobacter sp. MM222]|nr:hypothetical protein NKCBBBOE_00127 [Pseudarthrobacter sp. MM222]
MGYLAGRALVPFGAAGRRWTAVRSRASGPGRRRAAGRGCGHWRPGGGVQALAARPDVELAGTARSRRKVTANSQASGELVGGRGIRGRAWAVAGGVGGRGRGGAGTGGRAGGAGTGGAGRRRTRRNRAKSPQGYGELAGFRRIRGRARAVAGGAGGCRRRGRLQAGVGGRGRAWAVAGGLRLVPAPNAVRRSLSGWPGPGCGGRAWLRGLPGRCGCPVRTARRRGRGP